MYLMRKQNLRAVFAATALAAVTGLTSLATADTFLSGFEGNLDTSIGTPWVLQDYDGGTAGDQTWSSEFDTTLGVTEGTQALQLNHGHNAWQAGLLLNSTAVIPLVANSDTLEFDITTAPETSWRAVWVIMQGDGLPWNGTSGAQADQIDVAPGAPVHAVLNLNDSDNDPLTPGWKQSAQASPGTWWQIIIAVMGADLAPTADFDFDNDVDGNDFLIQQRNIGNMAAGQEHGDTNFDAIVDATDVATWTNEFARGAVSTTIIDNIKFVGGAAAASSIPEPTALATGLVGAALLGLAARRRRAGNDASEAR